MNPKFIKRHPESGTLIIKKFSFFENEVILPGNALVGMGCDFWGDLVVKGNLALGKGSKVKGDVIAENATIGADCEIKGNIKVDGNLTLLDRTKVGGLAYSSGNMIVRPMVSARAAECAGDIHVTGKTDIKSIQSGRKLVVRAG